MAQLYVIFIVQLKRHPHIRIRGDLRFLSAVCMRFLLLPTLSRELWRHNKAGTKCHLLQRSLGAERLCVCVCGLKRERFKVALELGLFLGHV